MTRLYKITGSIGNYTKKKKLQMHILTFKPGTTGAPPPYTGMDGLVPGTFG